MDIGLDIAALSVDMSASKVAMQKDIAVMKQAMDMQEEMASLVINKLLPDAPVDRSMGGHIDISI